MKTKRHILKEQIKSINELIRIYKANRKPSKADYKLEAAKEEEFNRESQWFKACGRKPYLSLNNLRQEARRLTILSGLLNGKPYEEIERNPREPFGEKQLQMLLDTYENMEVDEVKDAA